MLPFLEPKKMGSIIIAKRKASGQTEPVKEEGSEHPGLLTAAEDLISAVHSKSAEAVASALKAAFQIVDSEEPSTEEEDSGDFKQEE